MVGGVSLEAPPSGSRLRGLVAAVGGVVGGTHRRTVPLEGLDAAAEPDVPGAARGRPGEVQPQAACSLIRSARLCHGDDLGGASLRRLLCG
jgi:hypothetical protein